ncbi:hypothetical protein Tco_0023184, partial [Tanacetum coccineum]
LLCGHGRWAIPLDNDIFEESQVLIDHGVSLSTHLFADTGWCGQAYKDLLWRAASATNVRDFEKCMLELKTMNAKAHEWLNKIPVEH